MTTSAWIPHTAADLAALLQDQLTPRDPSDRLQAQMRRGSHGHIVCQRCGGKVRYGWCYTFGAIVLATCAKRHCRPGPPWAKVVNFVSQQGEHVHDVMVGARLAGVPPCGQQPDE